MAEPRLSIIVPVYNEARQLPQFLEVLVRWLASLEFPAELLLVDGGSTDATPQIAEKAACQLLRGAKGRARQMNLGGDKARGAFLLFLHCDTDMDISPTSLAGILQENPQWGFFRVRLSGSDLRFRIIERAMNLRSRFTRVATGDQGLLVRREIFKQLGGFADIPLMEDVEICKRLRVLAPPRVMGPPMLVSSRRWEQKGLWRTVLLMWRLRLSYFLGADPAQLARRYYG